MSINHFRELSRIAESEGLDTALAYDWQRTKEDIKECGKGAEAVIGSLAATGLICAGIIVAAPIVAIALAPTIAGAFKGTEERRNYLRGEKEIIENTPRERFNQKIHDLGNKISLVPKFLQTKTNMNYGLGDFLTQNINLYKVGALAGGVLGAYPLVNEAMQNQEGIRAAITAYMTWPAWIVPAGIGSLVGLAAGGFAQEGIKIAGQKIKKYSPKVSNLVALA